MIREKYAAGLEDSAVFLKARTVKYLQLLSERRGIIIYCVKIVWTWKILVGGFYGRKNSHRP